MVRSIDLFETAKRAVLLEPLGEDTREWLVTVIDDAIRLARHDDSVRQYFQHNLLGRFAARELDQANPALCQLLMLVQREIEILMEK